MSDELKSIEIEAARVRLQREKLLLQKEINKKNSLDSVAGLFGKIFDLFGSIIGFLFSVALGIFVGAIFGGVLWFGSAMVMHFNSSNPSWEFMARIGFALGRMPDALTAAFFIIPMLYFVFFLIKRFFGK